QGCRRCTGSHPAIRHRREEFVVVAWLPQASAERTCERESRSLLRLMDKSARVGRFGLSLDEQVNVVWHEAVRDYFHVERSGDVQNLLANRVNVVRIDEPFTVICR